MTKTLMLTLGKSYSEGNVGKSEASWEKVLFSVEGGVENNVHVCP